MLTDSERFSFLSRRYHGFASAGNAYDATQMDVRISDGDTLIIMSEGVIGVAHCWPFAVTAASGQLHGVKPAVGDTLGNFASTFNLIADDTEAAIVMAMALGFAIDPALAALKAPAA